MNHENLLGEEKITASLTIPNQVNRQRVALAAITAGANLVALALLWPRLQGSLGAMLLFTLLAVSISVVGAVWINDKIQKNRLQKWEPFLEKTLGSAPRLHAFHNLGDATDALCAWFENILEDRSRKERDSFISTIVTLAKALEARDATTRNHSSKVAALAVRIGRRMGLSHEELYEIHLGGLLHDIGKIGIRDDILLKPSGLTKAEFETMKSHPEVGYEIISAIPGMNHIAEIVRYHHEMYDGSGYPAGLIGEDIPLGARLVAVADTYMALTEDRPYRAGRTVEKAIKELNRVAGQQLDPEAIAKLAELLQEDQSPARSNVRTAA